MTISFQIPDESNSMRIAYVDLYANGKVGISVGDDPMACEMISIDPKDALEYFETIAKALREKIAIEPK